METKKKPPLSAKQTRYLKTPNNRINLLCGSVRLGKTYVSLLKFALSAAAAPAGHEFIMVGKSVTALKRNCLILLEKLVGQSNFRFSVSAKQAQLFGKTVWLEGANDARSESKIRGMTLGGAYCDELTMFPQDFYNMLLS